MYQELLFLVFLASLLAQVLLFSKSRFCFEKKYHYILKQACSSCHLFITRFLVPTYTKKGPCIIDIVNIIIFQSSSFRLYYTRFVTCSDRYKYILRMRKSCKGRNLLHIQQSTRNEQTQREMYSILFERIHNSKCNIFYLFIYICCTRPR